MSKSKPTGTRRYQPRLSLDDRMGEVFQELMALPEEVRRSEITFLMQLGYWTKKALGNSIPAAFGAALIASAGATPEHMAACGADSPREQLTRSRSAGDESAGAAVACLQGWCVDDDALDQVAQNAA